MKNRKFFKFIIKYRHVRMNYNGFYEGRRLQFMGNGYQARDIIRGFIRTIDKESKVSKV